MYKAIQSERLYRQIVQQIEASIVSGELKAGAQLPAERDLAHQFGVSRSAVREAVKALCEKGLVEAYSGRGTFVTNGTSQAFRESLGLMARVGQRESVAHLTVMREMLEPEIAALAATRMDEPHLALMREAMNVMDQSQDDAEAYIEADLDFHLALAEAAGNPIILLLLDSVVGLLREQRTRTFYTEGGPPRGQFHHQQILAAIERRDPDAAREAMKAHMRQVREDVLVSQSQAGQPNPAAPKPIS